MRVLRAWRAAWRMKTAHYCGSYVLDIPLLPFVDNSKMATREFQPWRSVTGKLGDIVQAWPTTWVELTRWRAVTTWVELTRWRVVTTWVELTTWRAVTTELTRNRATYPSDLSETVLTPHHFDKRPWQVTSLTWSSWRVCRCVTCLFPYSNRLCTSVWCLSTCWRPSVVYHGWARQQVDNGGLLSLLVFDIFTRPSDVLPHGTAVTCQTTSNARVSGRQTRKEWRKPSGE